MSAHIAKLRPMVDFASLAKLLVRAERETTLCVLQARLSIATSRHLLARVAAQHTLLSGPASSEIGAGDIAIAETPQLTMGPYARVLAARTDR